MIRFGLFVLTVGVLIASVAVADIPLPENLKYIDPRVRFVGIETYADYVFYVSFQTFTGAPYGVPNRLLEVKNSNPFNLNAERRLSDVTLLAMKRKEFEKRTKDDPSLGWLTDKAKGVLWAKITPPSTTTSVEVQEAPVMTYHVMVHNGKLLAAMIDQEKTGAAPPKGLLPTWAVGVVSFFALGWCGVWWVRHKKRFTRRTTDEQ